MVEFIQMGIYSWCIVVYQAKCQINNRLTYKYLLKKKKTEMARTTSRGDQRAGRDKCCEGRPCANHVIFSKKNVLSGYDYKRGTIALQIN